MPCVEIFSTGVILNQPVSTLLVYTLGALWLWAGIRFWKTRGDHKTKAWWSVSLVLGGIAAISAGTSYQAFGYEIKCVGREFCTWTSWWEITYMIIQVASLNTMLIAVAYSCTTGTLRKSLIVYAYANTLIHFGTTVVGATLPNKFMLSFEMLVLFSAPAFLMLLIINSWNYINYKKPMDQILLGAWAILLTTNALYFAYLQLGYTQTLWEKGIWFSENDVLHLLMMAWVLYIGLLVAKNVDDAPPRLN